MEILTAIYAGIKAIGALPEIISAFKELIGWLEIQFGPDWATRLTDLKAASTQWSSASTTKERENAAKALAAAFNSHK